MDSQLRILTKSGGSTILTHLLLAAVAIEIFLHVWQVSGWDGSVTSIPLDMVLAFGGHGVVRLMAKPAHEVLQQGYCFARCSTFRHGAWSLG